MNITEKISHTQHYEKEGNKGIAQCTLFFILTLFSTFFSYSSLNFSHWILNSVDLQPKCENGAQQRERAGDIPSKHMGKSNTCIGELSSKSWISIEKTCNILVFKWQDSYSNLSGKSNFEWGSHSGRSNSSQKKKKKERKKSILFSFFFLSFKSPLFYSKVLWTTVLSLKPRQFGKSKMSFPLSSTRVENVIYASLQH